MQINIYTLFFFLLKILVIMSLSSTKTTIIIMNHVNLGSTIVGKSILKTSAESNLKKVTLELGGKSPSIIFEDADLDSAVKWTNMGIYYNQGQVCFAGSRVYVQDTI